MDTEANGSGTLPFKNWKIPVSGNECRSIFYAREFG